MLELYNMTKDIKRIPRFNYNGKYVIKPHESVDIPEDQAFFFKPYAKTGIVVRCKKNDTPREHKNVVVTSGKNAAQAGFLDVGISASTTVETLSSPTYEEPEVESKEVVEEVKPEVAEPVVTEPVVEETPVVEEPVKEEVPETVQEVTDDTSVTYTEEQLSEMNREQLREVAKSLGIEQAATMGRKKDIQDLILAKQGK